MDQYGLGSLWSQGDFVTRSIAIILLIMSVLSWFVMIVKTLDLLRLKKAANSAKHRFWHSATLEEGLTTLGDARDNPFAIVASSGIEAAQHHRDSKPHLHDTLDISDWITGSLQGAIDDTVSTINSGLGVLASVGSTAPFVGLFGTVWGIYHALISIGASGQASIDKVAGPVGESLIMTALGLAVAIPAVLGYNAINRSNKGIINKLNGFARDLHAYLVTGSRVGKNATNPQTEIRVTPLKHA
ncbi:MotA/TolQ/ExbB proton channel family protein [Ampullimonas aquatilis]|uniref:MotA/TolQ/ExbB proton channel family protein n=1 Tax=Ampullimonas aquatilis TaxID=1341549 RepID=UPI003C72B027